MCPRGYYSNAGATTCTRCEAGYKCPSPYGSMRSACSAGWYSAAGSLNCYPVPTHMETTSTSARPYYCAFSEYSALTDNACTTCPADKYCPADNIGPISCPMSVELTSSSAYTSFSGEQSCFPRTGGRTGVNAQYAGSSSSRFDNKIAEGWYT